MNTNTQEEQFFFIEDVRKATNRSTATIDRWIRVGFFPAAHGKINGVRYWLKSTIDDWKNNLIKNGEAA